MSKIYAVEYKQRIVDALLRENPPKPNNPVFTIHNITVHDPRPIALNDANTAVLIRGVESEGIHGVGEYYYNRKTVIDHLGDLLHDEIVIDISDQHVDEVTYELLIKRINAKYGLYLVPSDFDFDLGVLVPTEELVDHGKVTLRFAEGSLMFYGSMVIGLRTVDLPAMYTMMDHQINEDPVPNTIDPPDEVVPPR